MRHPNHLGHPAELMDPRGGRPRGAPLQAALARLGLDGVVSLAMLFAVLGSVGDVDATVTVFVTTPFVVGLTTIRHRDRRCVSHRPDAA